MSTAEAIRHYSITVAWSEEDECYVARVPAFQFVAAHGDTPEEALREVQDALAGVVASMQDHGDELPEPDQAAEEIRRFEPILNLSALARRAGMNKHTLATKLKRGTRFTPEESRKIRESLNEPQSQPLPERTREDTVTRKRSGSSRIRETMSKPHDRTVYKADDGQWKNKRNDSDRASSSHRTQKEAEQSARELLKRQGGGELTTKGRDGKIRSKDTITPDRDPNPPRDTEH